MDLGVRDNFFERATVMPCPEGSGVFTRRRAAVDNTWNSMLRLGDGNCGVWSRDWERPILGASSVRWRAGVVGTLWDIREELDPQGLCGQC